MLGAQPKLPGRVPIWLVSYEAALANGDRSAAAITPKVTPSRGTPNQAAEHRIGRAENKIPLHDAN